MANVFRHGLVFLQLLQEDLLVELEHLDHVGEDHVFFADEALLRFQLLVAMVAQSVEVELDAYLEVLHVRLLRLKQLGHDEPVK